MVEREPEWDADQLELMLGLGLYESGVCECGWHKDLATDAGNYFAIEDRMCLVCRGTAQYRRVQQSQDEAAEKVLGEKPSPQTLRPADGRHTQVRMMSSAEVDERRSSRSRALPGRP